MSVDIVKEDIQPKCPFCGLVVEELIEVKRGFFYVNRVFCCPHCHKIVGISAGNG